MKEKLEKLVGKVIGIDWSFGQFKGLLEETDSGCFNVIAPGVGALVFFLADVDRVTDPKVYRISVWLKL